MADEESEDGNSILESTSELSVYFGATFDLADGLALTEKRGDGTADCATSSANHLLPPPPPPPLPSGVTEGATV